MQVVDENQNKLQLACFSYLRSEWFKLCCRNVDTLNEILIRPLQKACGIDEYKKVQSDYRSWFGLKELIPNLLTNLLTKLKDTTVSPGHQKLRERLFQRVKVAVENQVSSVTFYREADSMSVEKLDKLKCAPISNCGSESNLGDLTYDITRSAGSDTTMQTFSNKNVIRKNKLFNSTKWKTMSKSERTASWKWARNSPQAKKVREIGKKYIEAL